MRIDRSKLVKHLEKISCGGQVPDVIFSGAFQASALTEDQLLLVQAPPIPGIEPLADVVGVGDLTMFIGALGLIAGAGNEGVEVDVEFDPDAGRLIIDEDYRGAIKLMTAAPKTISTKIEETTVEKLLTKAPVGEGIPLTRDFIDSVRKMFGFLKVTEIELFVGPKGGKVRIGNDNTQLGEIPRKELTAEEEYSVLFAKHMVDALSVVSNYADAKLILGGPAEFATVVDGDYRYLLGPRTRGAGE